MKSLKQRIAFALSALLIIAAFIVYSHRADSLPAGAFGAGEKADTLFALVRRLAGE